MAPLYRDPPRYARGQLSMCHMHQVRTTGNAVNLSLSEDMRHLHFVGTFQMETAVRSLKSQPQLMLNLINQAGGSLDLDQP